MKIHGTISNKARLKSTYGWCAKSSPGGGRNQLCFKCNWSWKTADDFSFICSRSICLHGSKKVDIESGKCQIWHCNRPKFVPVFPQASGFVFDYVLHCIPWPPMGWTNSCSNPDYIFSKTVLIKGWLPWNNADTPQCYLSTAFGLSINPSDFSWFWFLNFIRKVTSCSFLLPFCILYMSFELGRQLICSLHDTSFGCNVVQDNMSPWLPVWTLFRHQWLKWMQTRASFLQQRQNWLFP